MMRQIIFVAFVVATNKGVLAWTSNSVPSKATKTSSVQQQQYPTGWVATAFAAATVTLATITAPVASAATIAPANDYVAAGKYTLSF